MSSAGRLLLGPAQADDDAKNAPPPNPQPEHQEKGHRIHALSSVGGRPAYSGLPLCFTAGMLKISKKP